MQFSVEMKMFMRIFQWNKFRSFICFLSDLSHTADFITNIINFTTQKTFYVKKNYQFENKNNSTNFLNINRK